MEKLYLKVNETYTFNIENRFFAEHLPVITTSSSGGTLVGEVSVGVVNVWQTSYGKEWTGNVSYENSGEDLKVYTDDASLLQKTELQKLKIEFTPVFTGTYYIQCAKYSEHLGKELVVYSDYGDHINPEEVYYTCLLRQSNRTYSFNSNDDLFDKFLNFYTPAGVWSRVKNLSPIISGFTSNKDFYDPDDDAIISGLISDPEDDILSYSWSQVGHVETISGFSLLSSIADSTSKGCTVDLVTPPNVETQYSFRLDVSDTDNTTTDHKRIPMLAIQGDFVFSGWGTSNFMLGDDKLPYSYYATGIPVEEGTGTTKNQSDSDINTKLALDTTISGSVGLFEEEPGIEAILPDITNVLSGLSFGINVANYEGIVQATSGLSSFGIDTENYEGVAQATSGLSLGIDVTVSGLSETISGMFYMSSEAEIASGITYSGLSEEVTVDTEII